VRSSAVVRRRSAAMSRAREHGVRPYEIAYNSCLMGKIPLWGAGDRCIGGSVDLEIDSPLRTTPWAAVSRPEVKGRFRRAGGPVPQCFEHSRRIHGAGRLRWSQVSRVRSTTTRSEDPVSPRSAIVPSADSARNRCNGEQKQLIDAKAFENARLARGRRQVPLRNAHNQRFLARRAPPQRVDGRF